MKNRKNTDGITIIALVITIVVLLILAGITIASFTGDKGLLNETKDMKNNIEDIQNQTIDNLHQIANELASSSGGALDPDNPEIPEGLEVGSPVTYNPSGTYNWQAKYCSSTKTETIDDVTLNSGEANFKISEWKVLSIDTTTGKVELVPSSPTTGTVFLGHAQGYNNGVKLLNDACSNLYGNDSKGITARSINIEDIEKYMTQEALTGTNGVHNYVDTDNNIKYGNQVSNAYTSYKNYPVIYAKEKKAVINGLTPEGATLGFSDTLDRFIERTEKRSNRWKINSNY